MTMNDFLSRVRSYMLPSGILAGRAMDVGENLIQYQEMAKERAKQDFAIRTYSFASGKHTYVEATPEEREQWKSTQRAKGDGLYAVAKLAELMDMEL